MCKCFTGVRGRPRPYTTHLLLLLLTEMNIISCKRIIKQYGLSGVLRVQGSGGPGKVGGLLGAVDRRLLGADVQLAAGALRAGGIWK